MNPMPCLVRFALGGGNRVKILILKMVEWSALNSSRLEGSAIDGSLGVVGKGSCVYTG